MRFRRLRRRIQIQRAGEVTAQPEPRQDADRGRDRHRQHHTQKAERGGAGEQREDHPDGGQFHPVAQKAGIDHIGFQQLSRDQHADHDPDMLPVRELRQRQADGGHAACHRADIGDEREQPRAQPHDQPQIQARSGQAGGIEERQDQAAHRLPAHPGGQDAVHLPRLRRDDPGVAARHPRSHLAGQPRPVAQEVKPDHGCHDRQRQHVEDGETTADDAGRGGEQDAQQAARLAAHHVAQFVVDDIRSKVLLEVVQLLPGPALEEEGVVGDAGDQEFDL